jgi:pimeloyl-ACP methyl ester carboxylesterase
MAFMQCDLGTITVYYEIDGEGKAIIMLHGLRSDHRQMVFEMERHFAQREGWKRIYLDLPGMGKTPGADWVMSNDQVLDVLEQFVDRVIPGQHFLIAGNSYGSYLARGLLYRRGSQIDGALLSGPIFVGPSAQKNLPAHVVVVRNPAIMGQARAESMAWLEALDWVVTENATVLAYARAMSPPPAHDVEFIARLEEGFSFSFDADALPRPFGAPTLFLTGRQDNVAGYRDAWSILEHYPRATFAVLDGAGHFMWGEKTAVCEALVSDWLDRVEEWTGRGPNSQLIARDDTTGDALAIG